MKSRLLPAALAAALLCAQPVWAQSEEDDLAADTPSYGVGDLTGGGQGNSEGDGKSVFGGLFGGSEGGTLSKFKGRFIDTVKPAQFATDPATGAGEKGMLLVRREARGPDVVPVPLPDVERYAEGILKRLLAHSPVTGVKTRVVVVAKDQIHGEAYPDGTVFVALGAIRNFKSEDEFAALLAHEVSHVIIRHHESDWFVSSQEKGLAALDIALAAKSRFDKRKKRADGKPDWDSIKIRAIGRAVVFASDVFIDSPFTRAQEDEADLLGTDLLVAAGYNPDGMSIMLDGIVAQEAKFVKALKEQARQQDAEMEKDLLQNMKAKGFAGLVSGMLNIGGKVLGSAEQELRRTLGAKHRAAEERRVQLSRYLDRSYAELPPAEMSETAWKRMRTDRAVVAALEGYRDAGAARGHLNGSDYAAAVGRIRKALAGLVFEHGQPRVVAAEISAAAGDRRLAELFYRQALAAKNPTLSAYAGLAHLQRRSGRLKQSLKTLAIASKALGKPPQLLPDLIALVRTTRAKGKVAGLMLRCKLTAMKALFKQCLDAKNGKFNRLPDPAANFMRAVAGSGRLKAGSGFVRVAVPTLNARKGPGTAHSRIREFKNGVRLMVVGGAGKWHRVQSTDGGISWVAKRLTRPVRDVRAQKFPGARRPTRASSPHRSGPPRKATEPARDIVKRLKRLKFLHQQGVLSDQEYKRKRAEIIESL